MLFWTPHSGDEVHTVFNLIFGAPLNGDQTEFNPDGARATRMIGSQ
jgi:hypothetical protein